MRSLAVVPLAFTAGCLAAGTGQTAFVPSADTVVITRPAAAQTGARLEVALHGGALEWSTSPRVDVSAQLVRDGNVVGRGQSPGNASGAVTIWLSPADPPVEPGSGPYVTVRPGDVVIVAPQDTQPVTVTVPTMAAEIDPILDNVSGIAPPGSTLTVSLVHSSDPDAETLSDAVSGPDGRFAVDFVGEIDLVPGHSGAVVLATAEGHVFSAGFAVLEVEATLASGRLKGRGTPGSRVGISTQPTDGAPRSEDGVEIHDGLDWQLPHPSQPPRLEPLDAGALITVTHIGTLGDSRVRSATIPQLSVVADDARDTIRGTGPVSSSLELAAVPPDGAPLRITTTTDSLGRYELDLTDTVDIDAGWEASATFDAGDGFRFRARDVVARVGVWVHDSTVSGNGAPGGVVFASLYSADGTLKDQGVDTAEEDGTFRIRFGIVPPPPRPAIKPGDIVEVEFTRGDPLFFRAPLISAVTDPDAETVSGLAPSGTELRVVALGDEKRVVRLVTADGSGRYSADFSDELDIEPTTVSGYVEVPAPVRHAYWTGWAATRISVSYLFSDVAHFGVSGPHGRAARAEVFDPSGDTVFVASGRSGESERLGDPAAWGVELVDEAGQPVPLLAGDRIVAAIGDDTATLIAPPLNGAMHIEYDQVSGRTSPDLPVRITVRDSWSADYAVADVVADGQGFFSHDFGGELDLRHYSWCEFSASVGRHRVARKVSAPGVTLDLDLSSVEGSAEPGQVVDVSLRTGSTIRASQSVMADRRGWYSARLLDVGGRLADAQPGDVLTVSTRNAQRVRPIIIIVPELAFETRIGRTAVTGRATPGGRLMLDAQNMYPYPEWGLKTSARAQPNIRDDGTFAANLVPATTLDPGWRVRAEYWLPSGNRVRRTRHVPMVNVQHGGSHVCGHGVPGAAVRGALTDADGSPLAEASGMVNRDGTFDVILQDERSRAAQAGAGMRVTVDVGRDEVTFTLPEIDLDVTWPEEVALRVIGRGPSNMRWSVIAPVNDCRSNLMVNGSGQGIAGVTDDAGYFEGQMLRTRANGQPIVTGGPGEGLEVAFLREDGHRYYRIIIRALARAHVRTDRVTGDASPYDHLAISLYGQDASALAHGEGVADAEGGFDVRLKDLNGEPATMVPGDRLDLRLTHESVTVAIEDLWFDFSALSGISGLAPPNRDIGIELLLRDARTLRVKRETDVAGRFSYTPNDVLPRAPWRFEDIAWVETVLQTPNRHEIVSEVTISPELPSPIHLPIAVSLH